MNTNQLAAVELSDVFVYYPGSDRPEHRFYEIDPRISDSDSKKWEKYGKPYQWIKVFDKDGITCFAEVAYGHVALFKGDTLISNTPWGCAPSINEYIVIEDDNNKFVLYKKVG